MREGGIGNGNGGDGGLKKMSDEEGSTVEILGEVEEGKRVE